MKRPTQTPLTHVAGHLAAASPVRIHSANNKRIKG